MVSFQIKYFKLRYEKWALSDCYLSLNPMFNVNYFLKEWRDVPSAGLNRRSKWGIVSLESIAFESIAIAPWFEKWEPWLLRVGRLTGQWNHDNGTGRPGGQPSKARGSQTRERQRYFRDAILSRDYTHSLRVVALPGPSRPFCGGGVVVSII